MANISSHIIYIGGSASDEHISDLSYDQVQEKLTATTNFGATYTTPIPAGGGGGGTPTLTDVLNQGNDADQNAIENLDTIEFTTNTPVDVRKAAWGAVDGTLNVGLSAGSSLLSLPIGMTTVFLGFSEEVATLSKLTVVRVKGSKFGYAKIAPAKADNYSNVEGAIGVAAQQVLSNDKGYVVLNGDILNVDTTGAPYSETWGEGDKLYVSASNAGKLTNIAPTSPNLTIMVGYVKDVHPTKGSIFVNYPRAINIPAPSVSATDVTYIDTYGQGVANVQDAIDDLRSDVSNIGLEAILAVSNTSGAYSILFDTNQGLGFNNGSKFTEGTTDGGLGGARGLAQICSVGYELKWEAGRLYVMEQGGFTIRWVLFQLNNDPSAADDDSKGYIVGSRWTKDDGTTFICTDATTSSAIWELQSGAVPTLAQVLTSGNASGSNDINFDATQGLLFSNYSRVREGTIDAGFGGQKGVALICAVGYEYKWEAGRLYVMDGNGIYIRHSLHNFTLTPTINDDVTKGYLPGSRWSLDNGDTYICTDETTGAAVWELESNGVPTLAQVLIAGKSAGNSSIIDIDKLDFNTATATSALEGQLAWNDTLGTLDLGLKGGNTISNLGQHLHARVVNKVTPNQTLTKAGYKAVRVSGAQGQRLAVELAQANNDANSADTIGLVCESIATNQEGFIICVGQIVDINTTGSLQGETWADGDVLYLSPFTAGQITKVKPIGAGHIVVIGYVEYAHAIHGKIYVKTMNGWELDELHDVSITSAANGNYLEYDGTLWVNRGIVYTVELIAALTVDFYAPYNMKINSVTSILNSPTTTIQDDGAAYTLTNTIAAGSKITVTVNIASVVNLNITKA